MKTDWSRKLARVVRLRDGKTAIATLADARAYLLALPEGKQQYQSWQSAAAALLTAAEDEHRIGDATDAIECALFLDGFKWLPEHNG